MLNVPPFDRLTPTSREAFEASAMVIRYKAHEYLIEPNMTAQYLYFILKGAVRQFYVHGGKEKEGKEVVFNLALEQDFCTSVYSFITRRPCFEYIETVEDTEVVQISHAALQKLYEHYHDIANLGRVIAEQYLAQEQERGLAL